MIQLYTMNNGTAHFHFSDTLNAHDDVNILCSYINLLDIV